MEIKVIPTEDGHALVEKFRVRESTKADNRVEAVFFVHNDGTVSRPLWKRGEKLYSIKEIDVTLEQMVKAKKPCYSLLEKNGFIVRVIIDGDNVSVRLLKPIAIKKDCTKVLVTEENVTHEPFFYSVAMTLRSAESSRLEFLRERL